MEVISLIVLLAGGVGVYSLLKHTENRREEELQKKDRQDNSVEEFFDENISNYSETGVIYDTIKPTILERTNTNDAYTPYSAPNPDLENVGQFLIDRAENVSLAQTNYLPFFVDSQNDSIHLDTAHQTLPVVIVPGERSIKGDENSSLMRYPLTLIDPGTQQNQQGLYKAGASTEINSLRERDNGEKLYLEVNPWGAGSALQNAFNRLNMEQTLRRGLDQSRVFF